MEVSTCTASWFVPDIYLPKIGLLNSIKIETEDTKVSLPQIDDDSFRIVFEQVTSITNNIDTYNYVKSLPLEKVIDIIHLCDYLQCEELLREFCRSIADQLEELGDDTLNAVRLMWEQKQMLIK